MIEINKKFFKYILTSFLATGVDLLLFTFFSGHLFTGNPDRTKAIRLATFIARAVSLTINYRLTNKYVFGHERGNGKSFFRYIGINVVKLGLSAHFVAYFSKILTRNLTFIKIIVDVTLFFLGYFFEKKIVF